MSDCNFLAHCFNSPYKFDRDSKVGGIREGLARLILAITLIMNKIARTCIMERIE